MESNGWIKISRALNRHWLWQDAERLKWWLDLLLMAAWEDTETMHDSRKFTLKRGQIVASVAFLCDRWNKSHPTVIRFLKLLESEDMIYRQTLYRQTPVITICNYESYQDFGNNNVYTQVDRQLYSIVYTNKEYNNISSSTIKSARACEELSSDRIWVEAMCMQWHLSEEQLLSYIGEFSLHNTCEGSEEHKNKHDLKKHFNSWLRIKINEQLKGTNNERTTKTNGASRRAAEATIGTRKDYEGSF